MPAVDIFMAVVGLAERSKPGAALRPWAGCTRSSLLEVRNERDRVGLGQDKLLTG